MRNKDNKLFLITVTFLNFAFLAFALALLMNCSKMNSSSNISLTAIFVLTLSIISTFLISIRPILLIVKVKSESMEPSIFNGDIVLAERLSALVRSRLSKESIVLLSLPELDKELFVKRIVGLPGDRVEITNGKFFLNGEKSSPKNVKLEDSMYEIKILGDIPAMPFVDVAISNHLPIVVPAEFCFVLGDNRNNSFDSHDIGFIPLSRVEGRVFFILPLNQIERKMQSS